MGDSVEGSSAAAQGAQADSPEGLRRAVTFFDSLFRSRPEPAEPQRGGSSGEEAAAASKGADEMLVNIGRIRDMRAETVAVPRSDIVAVPLTVTEAELVRLFRESAVTRVPVYGDTLDSPLGLVHFKDFALKHGFGAVGMPFDLESLMRPLLYVPPSMPIGVLLQKMQAERMHMALVIDEYGGVDGLITIEDVVEEIVGDIADEHDLVESDPWVEESPGVYLAWSRTPLDDFAEAVGVELAPGDLDSGLETLGGLVSALAGRVPVRGEVVAHPGGHRIEVVDADRRHVKRLRLRLAGQVRDSARLPRATG